MSKVLVVAWSDLAEKVSKLPLIDVSYVVTVADAKELRHKIHEHQPEVVVLDHRVGGNRFLAIEEVPAIVDRTATHPRVIVLLPKTSTKIEREAARRGCYDVVSVPDRDFEEQVCAAVETAVRYRKAQKDRRAPAVSRRKMH